MRPALRIKPRQHRKRRPAAWPASLIAGVATTVTALSLLGAAPAGASSMAAAGPAGHGAPEPGPDRLTARPRAGHDAVGRPVRAAGAAPAISSPSVAADAPYTPAVLNLIAQLEPGDPPTEAQLANASTVPRRDQHDV